MTDFFQGQWTEVPPPKIPPQYSRASELGLLSCFRTSPTRDVYRCENCNKMQPVGAEQVWVTDGICMGDEEWSIQELSRLSAYNGHATAWCLDCARKLTNHARKPPAESHPATESAPPKSLFKRLIEFLYG